MSAPSSIANSRWIKAADAQRLMESSDHIGKILLIAP